MVSDYFCLMEDTDRQSIQKQYDVMLVKRVSITSPHAALVISKFLEG